MAKVKKNRPKVSEGTRKARSGQKPNVVVSEPDETVLPKVRGAAGEGLYRPHGRSEGAQLARAQEMFADGFTVSTVGRTLEIGFNRAKIWRDKPETQAHIDNVVAQVRADAAGARKLAQERVASVLSEAVDVLVKKLVSKVPFEDITAATALLDRGGVPKVTKVETDPEPEEDLSLLSPTQLAALDDIRRTLRGD